jgi:YegS/Rv2252/BmrU family lipid kinase
VTVRREDTRDLEHAKEIALEAARRGETTVALSGDGMVGAIADALRAVPGATLGVLPGGRGNDLARVLGIPRDPIAACATIAHGEARALDVGEVSSAGTEGRAFVGIASVGFDSDANQIANEAPPWLGGLVYAYAALRALASWRPATFELELDPPGQRVTFTGYSVGAANSRAYGGGMHAAPAAMLDDGLLDVVVVERVSRLRFLANLPRVFKGTHVEVPTVRVFRCAQVTVTADRPFEMYADGDPVGALPVSVRALHGAIRVLTPSAGSAALAPDADAAGAGAASGGSAA